MNLVCIESVESVESVESIESIESVWSIEFVEGVELTAEARVASDRIKPPALSRG